MLPLGGAFLRAVSRSGELAVVVKSDVLARVPIGGAGIRDVKEHVFDADWAPDGSVAVVRQDPGRSWVEYPLGKIIYELTHAINAIRLSPDGALVAVMEQERFGGGAEWLTIIDRNGAIVKSSRKQGATVADSLAWTPDGNEVWFTASADGGRAAIHGMTRDGRERIVHSAMGSLRILDIAPDGRTLLANDSFRAEMSLVDLNAPGERDLTWKDWSRPFALSNDGRTVAFGGGGRNDKDGRVFGYIRHTDGSPAILLSEAGNPCAFSRDGNWVLTSSPTSSGWTMVPTGVGEPRHIDVGQLAHLGSWVRWLRDDRQIVYSGGETGRPSRLFLQSIAGGLPQAFTPEGVAGPLIVSPDSAFVIVRNGKGQLLQYPVEGGAPTVVAGAAPREQPLAWNPDGESIWVLNRDTRPAKIFHIELKSGRRSLWREVPYSDPAAIEFDQLRVVMSADGSKFVYGYQEHLSELFVAKGLQ